MPGAMDHGVRARILTEEAASPAAAASVEPVGRRRPTSQAWTGCWTLAGAVMIARTVSGRGQSEGVTEPVSVSRAPAADWRIPPALTFAGKHSAFDPFDPLKQRGR